LTTLASLLLGDGRFPAGGHAHSGGVEAAIVDGRVHDIDSLRDFVLGRLATVGLVEAAFAAAATAQPGRLAELDAELDARLVAPPVREASRRLGRALTRVASRCWPHPVWLELPSRPHQPIALGAACVAAGADAAEAATLAVHHAINTPALAAVRLLGLDPVEVAALTARAAEAGAAVIAEAVNAAGTPIADLPCATTPILEIAAIEHHQRELRMFAT
jgi:urease accessory protein